MPFTNAMACLAAPHEHYRNVCNRKIDKELQTANDLLQAMPPFSAEKPDGIHTKKQCLNEYIKKLKYIQKALANATTEEDGKREFKFTIEQLETWLQNVVDAGWKGIMHVEFKRVSQLGEDAAMDIDRSLDAQSSSCPPSNVRPKIAKSSAKVKDAKPKGKASKPGQAAKSTKMPANSQAEAKAAKGTGVVVDPPQLVRARPACVFCSGECGRSETPNMLVCLTCGETHQNAWWHRNFDRIAAGLPATW